MIKKLNALICERVTYDVDESMLNRIYCFKKCVFERIETNNKKNIMLEKVDQFIYENVWYFQAFCEVFAI